MSAARGFDSKKDFRILVGLSGGADSVALLMSLMRTGHSVEAMHCNFHLRGGESDRDQDFAEKLCDRLGVKLTTVHFDVDAYRTEHQVSVEEACRDLRYDAFRKYCRANGCRRVAVAHNSDDNAETVLMNLFRGAGVAGLRGMRADTGNVVRPLLGVNRKEIEGYLMELGQEFVVDSTNKDSLYARNFVRNELIPLIEKRWPSAKKAINNAARIMSHTERLIEEYDALHPIDPAIIPKDLLSTDELGRRRIHRMVSLHGGEPRITEEVIRLLAGDRTKSGKKWSVAEGELVMSNCGLEFVKRPVMSHNKEERDDEFEARQFENSEDILSNIKSDRSNRSLWLPFGPEKLRFRIRRDGDRIRPIGMVGSRLVSDVVSDAKLSAIRKREVIVAEDRITGEILWVEGLCRSRKCLIGPENKTIWKFVRKI